MLRACFDINSATTFDIRNRLNICNVMYSGHFLHRIGSDGVRRTFFTPGRLRRSKRTFFTPDQLRRSIRFTLDACTKIGSAMGVPLDEPCLVVEHSQAPTSSPHSSDIPGIQIKPDLNHKAVQNVRFVVSSFRTTSKYSTSYS